MRLAGWFVLAALAAPGGLALAEEPQVDCDNAIVQFDLTYCAGKEYEAADTALNAEWKTARAAAVAMDEDLEPGERGAEEALLKAQRAWIAYRDAACEAETFPMRGGTAWSMVVYGCKAKLTGMRTQELKRLAEILGG